MLGRVQFSLLEKAHKVILKEYEIFCCLTMLGLRAFGIFERNNGKKQSLIAKSLASFALIRDCLPVALFS